MKLTFNSTRLAVSKSNGVSSTYSSALDAYLLEAVDYVVSAESNSWIRGFGFPLSGDVFKSNEFSSSSSRLNLMPFARSGPASVPVSLELSPSL